MKNHPLDEEIDAPLQTINSATLYATALFVESDTMQKKGERLATDFAGSTTAKWTADALAQNIQKETPSGEDQYAIGSRHALDPFANAALARRNINDMSIPNWGKYSLNTISYLSASGSAFTRIQDGGHSFADQLVSVSVGNFIGLFFYEAFLSEEQKFNVSLKNDALFIQTNWAF